MSIDPALAAVIDSQIAMLDVARTGLTELRRRLEVSTMPAAGPLWYSRHALPPGCSSWRSARETAARLGVATAKPGRELLIDASDFDAKIAVPKAQRPLPGADVDEAALEQMGLVLPMRRRASR